jgi:3-oxoacyl-[acyl-carrier protein] reductase
MTGAADTAQPGAALAGRCALVTGGSRGIGRAVVERFVSDGAAVVFSYVHSDVAAEELAGRLRADGGLAYAVRADLEQTAAAQRLFRQAAELLGGLDIVVNNAGQTLVAAMTETTEQDFDRLMAVNAKAAFFIMQEAARTLRNGGRIINLSSANTVIHGPGIALYAGTKAAVEQFTIVAARELGIRHITVNAVSPGPVDTAMLRASQPPQALDLAAAATPLRRLGQPADVADVIAFLAGPDGRWINGQVLRATGGWV